MNVGKLLVCMMLCLLCMTCAGAEGLLCVSAEDTAALLTVQGQEIIAPGIWDDIFRLTDERYALGVLTEGGMRYALFDGQGRQLTNAAYEMLSVSDTVVIFRQNGRYGAMDMEGSLLIEPVYTQLTAAGDGFFAMMDDPYDEDADEIFRIAPNGEIIATGVSSDEGLTAVCDDRMPFQNPGNERYGYIDSTGQVVIEAQLETAGGFSGGLARASVNGLMGMIDPDGEWRIEPEYDHLEHGDGMIMALSGRECAVVFDDECRELFRVEGTNIEAAVVGGYPVLLEGNVMRVYVPEGNVLFEADSRAMVTSGLEGWLIIADGEWGTESTSLISPKGVRSEKQYQHLIPLADGRYAFIRMNAAAYFSDALEEVRYSCDYDSLRCGMTDAAGTEILPAEYMEIRALGENRFLAVAEDHLRVVDGDGNVIWSQAKGE